MIKGFGWYKFGNFGLQRFNLKKPTAGWRESFDLK
jgi:hypothetical protein